MRKQCEKCGGLGIIKLAGMMTKACDMCKSERFIETEKELRSISDSIDRLLQVITVHECPTCGCKKDTKRIKKVKEGVKDGAPA